MDIKAMFEFLISDYGFKYEKQSFVYSEAWKTETHSFYNESGCFTIHRMDARGELEFYHSKEFSKDRQELYKNPVYIETIEPEIWKKRSKIFSLSNPFFWCSKRKV